MECSGGREREWREERERRETGGETKKTQEDRRRKSIICHRGGKVMVGKKGKTGSKEN